MKSTIYFAFALLLSFTSLLTDGFAQNKLTLTSDPDSGNSLEGNEILRLTAQVLINGKGLGGQKVKLTIAGTKATHVPPSKAEIETNKDGKVNFILKTDRLAQGKLTVTAEQPDLHKVFGTYKASLSFTVEKGKGAQVGSILMTPSGTIVVEPKGGIASRGRKQTGAIPIRLKVLARDQAKSPLPKAKVTLTAKPTGSVRARLDTPNLSFIKLTTDGNGEAKAILQLTNSGTGSIKLEADVTGSTLIATATINVRQTISNYEVRMDGSVLNENGTSSVTSGDDKKIKVIVWSKNGNGMSGITVRFGDKNDSEISFDRERRTTSNGEASTTMRTGSEGPADFVIEVPGLKSRIYNVKVKPWTKPFTERYTKVFSRQDCWNRSWYGWTRYVDVPSRTVKSSVTIRTVVGKGDFGYRQGSKWHDHNTLKLWGRIREHCVETNTIRMYINGKYQGVASSRPAKGAPPLQPQTRPEMDTLSAFWEDMSQVPAETVLLSNYPNPFNPETWIPYHLSESADVTLTIYSADGKLVRTLALGHQAAGIYESKSRAAYWDGRNAVGERVASGVYFYTLEAGDFAATQNMLIMK